MKNMTFINSWIDRKAAWSGTPNGLFVALSKKMLLNEINVASSNNKNKIVNRLKWFCNLLTCQIFNNISIERKMNKNTTINPDIPVLAFGEYFTKATNDTYCYQDLSMDYIVRLRRQKRSEADFAIPKAVRTFFIKYKRDRANRFYKDCAGILTMSKWLREDLIERTGVSADKVHHVGGGCNIDISRIDDSKKRGFRFLFVGKSWERKNGELVVDAFEKLKNMCPGYDSELYIAGPTKMPPNLKNKKNIFFLGLLSHEQLLEYYNLCDFFVMPSKFEAYGLVFAEALCFGLPCVGKNCCAMPEFIQNGKNGYLIENENADELAEVMKKMLTDGKDMVRFVKENRQQYIEKYSWDSVADRIIKVFENDEY